MAAIGLEQFKTLKQERECLLDMCCRLIDIHDNNEWGEKTGSFPEGCELEGFDVGELGEVINDMRRFVGTTEIPTPI